MPPMIEQERQEIRERFELTMDLYELGEAMMRQNLRREHPEASEAEIEELLVAWLQKRPGAEYGDAPGRPGRLP
ncbi:MAG TPA: hypothetical protein DFS52_26455 [Myxococcales bacterium]|nr:hypothetical protein [Myxococcales bacterium]